VQHREISRQIQWWEQREFVPQLWAMRRVAVRLRKSAALRKRELSAKRWLTSTRR